VKLVTQADIDSQIPGDLPTVAHIPSELPLAAGRQNVLEALVRGRVEAEQECRISVVLVGRRAAIQSGGAAAETQVSARPIADLRLPMVQVMAHQVEAEAELVRTARVSQVVAMRIALFHAGHR